ncbi:MAG: flavodoxin [Rhodocyclaceae bacterium]
MSWQHDEQRRTLMAALAAFPLAGLSETAAGDAPRILVACFSRTGNTRVVAGLIQRALRADAFDIRPATPYPEDYLATVDQASRETRAGVEPALAARAEGWARYDTVFVGFPIWGMTAPPIIRSFLRTHDTAAKRIVPFITHGGYGLGNSLAVLARQAPNATLSDPFVLEADQERRTMERVQAWLANAAPASKAS